MRVSYHEGYFTPLPPGHRFPMAKFPVLYDILMAEGLIGHADVVTPDEADWDTLRIVHTERYLADLREGTLDAGAQRRMGLPWSPGLTRRSRLAAQGTINAAWMALADGVAANLAGGTHHAFADRGEGFCVLNDVALAIRLLKRADKIERALVVDLDVHQGNGTADVLRADEYAYTFSIHGEKNYPFHKVQSSHDVALPNDIGDLGYLDALAEHLPIAFATARPDFVVYLAGVDVVAGDRFGRLNLSRRGLHARDRFVLDMVRHHGVPVLLVLSGGYAATPERTADLHATVHREARAVFGR